MNKEFNDNNYQDAPHSEGQQNNIAQNRIDGTNNPPEVERAKADNEGSKQQNDSSGKDERRAESERANNNEDNQIRGGNSSI